MSIRIEHGDCREVIKTLANNSIDAVVTDPPYGLEFMGKEWDGPKGFAVRPGWQNGGDFTKPGIGERQTAWPSFSANSRFGAANPTCAACGGRARGKKRCSCSEPQWKPIGKRRNPENETAPSEMTGSGARNAMLIYQEWCEEWAREVYRVLKPGGHILCFGGTRTYHRLACAIEDAGFEIRDQIGWAYGTGFPKSHDVSKAIDKMAGAERAVIAEGAAVKRMILGADQNKAGWEKTNGREFVPTITEPATDEATKWRGWGTAFKPAWEPICVARKPLDGTVAENVLKWGTGALNIDGCRIEADSRPLRIRDYKETDSAVYAGRVRRDAAFQGGSKAAGSTDIGRWPANLCHDGSDEVVSLFPDSAGQQAGVRPDSGSGQKTDAILGKFATNSDCSPRGDSGSAARFFFSAKAGREDRWGSRHPTVKPISLMRWLARMVTPPGGVLLDPFAGSGTTGVAALAEGFNAILIEREEAYIADIKARLAHYDGDGGHSAQVKVRAAIPRGNLPLFGEGE